MGIIKEILPLAAQEYRGGARDKGERVPWSLLEWRGPAKGAGQRQQANPERCRIDSPERQVTPALPDGGRSQFFVAADTTEETAEKPLVKVVLHSDR